ncbi:unnamed protein product, partial [Closterium sp. NIES-54]
EWAPLLLPCLLLTHPPSSSPLPRASLLLPLPPPLPPSPLPPSLPLLPCLLLI